MPNQGNVDLDRLWRALQDSGACLTKLSLHFGISTTLMEYFAFYEGLIDAQFDVLDRSTPSYSPIGPDAFRKSLVGQVPTLSLLYIITDKPSKGWRDDLAINPKMWPVPSPFLKLDRLRVTSPKDAQLTEKHLQLLLDYVSQMPRLRLFKVMSQCANWNRSESTLKQEMMRSAEAVFFRRCKLEVVDIGFYAVAEQLKAGFKMNFPSS